MNLEEENKTKSKGTWTKTEGRIWILKQRERIGIRKILERKEGTPTEWKKGGVRRREGMVTLQTAKSQRL